MINYSAKRQVRILGSGVYLPSNKVSAEDISKDLGISEVMIHERAGVESRYWSDQEDSL